MYFMYLIFFSVVKRGCARKDPRYESTSGCEEQLTGGGFGLILCLCKESHCNNANHISANFAHLFFLTYTVNIFTNCQHSLF